MLYRLLLALATLLSPTATQPVAPPPEPTMLGANAWLSYYYEVANDSHHSQDWEQLLRLHADGCGQCGAIPNGSRLAGPGDIRRSPIVGGPSPVLSQGGDQVVFVTAVERVLPGGQIEERYIDQVTLEWIPTGQSGWRVDHLSFKRYE
jgi:hypothetical protein